MSTSLQPLLRRFNFFQTAYAVSDIDAAVDAASRLYGISNFQINRDTQIQTPLMHYLYADTREVLGHHLEFMYQTPAGESLFAQVPRHRA